MPAKATINDVKLFLEENDKNKYCTLISTEYINSTTPLTFRCNICGQEFKRDFAHIKRGRFKCEKCAKATSARPTRASIEDVKDFLNKYDTENQCTLLSTVYMNNTTPLLFQCNICGQEFYRDFNHLKRKRFRCEKCGELSGAKTKKYSKEDVQAIINKSGYVLVGEYINAATPVLTRCAKGHEFNLVFSDYLCGHSGCKRCANEANRGENHWNFQNGGHAEIMEHCRDIIKPWKQQFYLERGGISDLTGSFSKKGLVIHHLHNFSDIVKEASVNTGVPLLNHVSEYYEQGINIKALDAEVQRLNSLYPCVLIEREYHDEFHKLYGKKNNTEEQYQEFKQNKLKEIL